MKRRHILVVMAAFSMVACSDNSRSNFTGPADPSQPIRPSPSTAIIAGRISVTGAGADRLIELIDADGVRYRMVGTEARALASVDGGDVLVRGTLDANPGLVVEAFEVTSMHGRPALDGVLQETDGGFALRLSDGSLRVVPGLSSECAEHLGARLWVIGWEDDSEVAFGLIAAV